MPQESLQKIYKAGSEHYDLGDYDTFAKKMQNADSRQKFYSALSEHYDLGDYKTFEGKIFPEPAPTQKPGLREAISQRIPGELPKDKIFAQERQFGQASQMALGVLDLLGSIPSVAVDVFRGKPLTESVASGGKPFRADDFNDSPGSRDPERHGRPIFTDDIKKKIAAGTLTSEETKNLRKQTTAMFAEEVPATKEEKAEAANFAFRLTSDPFNFVGFGLGKKALNLIKLGKTAKATKTIDEIAKLAAKSNIDDVIKTLGKSEEETVLKQILGDIKAGKAPEDILNSIQVDVSKLPDVKTGKVAELGERAFAMDEGLKARDELEAAAKNLRQSPQGAAKLRESLRIRERIDKLTQQIEANKQAAVAVEQPVADVARRQKAIETGKRVFAEGAERHKQADKIIADLERIRNDVESQILGETPKVTKRKRFVVGESRIAEELTPLEQLTAKVKAGKATGNEIKAAARENAEEVEQALRQEFKAAKTSEEQGNIAQGIDIVTQESGKKPKFPNKIKSSQLANKMDEWAGAESLSREGKKTGKIAESETLLNKHPDEEFVKITIDPNIVKREPDVIQKEVVDELKTKGSRNLPPPVIEVNTNGEIVKIDGTHRIELARQERKPIEVYVPEKDIDIVTQEAGKRPQVPVFHKPSGLTPESTIFNTAPEKFEGYAWRSMGDKEYQKLIKGEKIYKGGDAGRGNFFAPTPQSAGQYGKKGKKLVEFSGVEKAEGETVSNALSKENITAVWEWTPQGWKKLTGKPQVPRTTEAQKVRTAISRDPDLHLQNSEIESIYGAGTEESKRLIKQIGGGKRTLDDVSLQLQEAGTISPAPGGYNSQHLINLISEDAPTVARAEQQAAKQADMVYGKTAKEAPKPAERPTPPKPKAEQQKLTYDELEVGDKFTINDEVFTVTWKELDDTGRAVGVKLKDSKNYEQSIADFETGVEFDKGSLKKAGEAPAPKAGPTPLEQVALGTEGYIQAVKNPGGYYQLFFRGTKNEIFPGEKFTTANEARQYWKVQKAKQAAKPIKEGESIPLQRGAQEFTEQQAKEGRKVEKITPQQRKEKFAKKLEEGKYEGDMFVEAEKGKQTSLLETPLEQLTKGKKETVKFQGLQQIPGTKKAAILVDLPNGSTVGLDEAIHALSKAEKAKLDDAIRASKFESVVDQNEAIRIMEGAPATKSGKDYAKGLVDAIKKDIAGETLGIVPDPLKNVREFLAKNNLKLTDDELQKLSAFAKKTLRATASTASKQQQIERYANNIIKTRIKPVPTPAVVMPKGEVSIIGQESPRMSGFGISADTRKRAANFLRKYFKSGGAKPGVVVRGEEKLRGHVAAKMRDIDRQLNMLKQSTKGIPELRNEAGLKKMDDYLKGDISINLPANVKANLDAMRDTIDNLSRRLMRSGIPGERLQLTIEEKLGQYVTRSYRKFLEPGYKPTEEALQGARTLFTHTIPSEMVGELPNLNYISRRYKLSVHGYQNIEHIANATPDELVHAINTNGYTRAKAADDIVEAQRIMGEIPYRIEGRIEELLAKDLDQANFRRGTVIGRVNLDNLKRRKDIDAAIRDLYGEIKDPYVNFHQTASKIISQVENRKFLEQMANYNTSLENGNPAKFLYDKSFKQGDNAYSVKISAEGNKALEPIDGLYTTKEIFDELKNYGEATQMNKLLRAFVQANTVAKYTKTVTSPITVIRNFYGNIGFAIANGHYRLPYMKEAMSLTRRNLTEKMFGADALRGDFKVLKDRFATEGIINRKQLHKKALELGVIEDNVYSGELKELLADMGVAIDQGKMVSAKGAAKFFRKSTQAATEIYSSMDDVWKLYGWFNEIARGKTLEQAARIVRDTYPTYSKVPRFGKEMRRFPVLGTFISFPTEVMRVGKNIAKMAIKEKDIPRLIGMSIATAGTFGTYLANNYAEGVTNEEQAALREFIAPWEKNGQLFITNIDDENISFINNSYTDPWSYISDPVRALFRGMGKGDVDGAFRDTASEFLDPYLSEGLFVERIIDFARNKKSSSGAPVYNEEDSYEDKFYKSAKHISETLVPPLTPVIGTQYQRLENALQKEITEYGQRDLLSQEAMNLVAGIRKHTLNKKQAVKFSGVKVERRIQEANRILNEGLRESSTIKDLKEKYQAMEEARKKIFTDFQHQVKAARTLGLSDEEIKNELLQGTNISQDVIDNWMQGIYTPYEPGKEKMERIQEKLGVSSNQKKRLRRQAREKREIKRKPGQKTPLEQLIGVQP